MNRKEFIQAIRNNIKAHRKHATKKDIDETLSAMQEVIKETLSKDEDIFVRDLFSIKTFTRKERKGYNPVANCYENYPEHKEIRCAMGSDIVDYINKPH